MSETNPHPHPHQVPDPASGEVLPEPDLDEAIDDQTRSSVTVGEMVQQVGAVAFVPVPLEEVE